MGKYNSSLTRVVPLLDQLKQHNNFPNNLLNTINSNICITEPVITIAYGQNEKTIMPSKKFLKYLVQNSNILNKIALGIDDGSVTYIKRKKLFELNIDTIKEALSLINEDKSCLNKWYIFEGYTHPDIYIETEHFIIIGEAKRTEKYFTTKTKWLNSRDQLIRHIDSVIESGKTIISFLLIDNSLSNSESYKTGLSNYQSKEYFIKNLPHRNENEIELAMNSFIGYSSWEIFQDKFNIVYIDVT